MSDREQTADGLSVFQEPSYARFWLARIFTTVSFQMGGVAVGWQVYALTHSTFALGMVGSVQFLPMLLLTLLVGHIADRFDRKTIIAICQVLQSLTLSLLAISSYLHRLHPAGIFCAVAAIGAARAFEAPSTQALVPGRRKRQGAAGDLVVHLGNPDRFDCGAGAGRFSVCSWSPRALWDVCIALRIRGSPDLDRRAEARKRNERHGDREFDLLRHPSHPRA